MPLIQQIAPSVYCIPSARSIMYAVRVGFGTGEQHAADRDHLEVAEDERWGRLGPLFEEGLAGISEAVQYRQHCSGMIYPREKWQPGDREWLRAQAQSMGLEVQIGPSAQQGGWHSDRAWIIFRWTALYLKAQLERSELLKKAQHRR